MLAANKFMVNTGMGGVKFGAFLGLSPQRLAQLRAAMYLGIGLDTGLALPLSAQAQIEAGEEWDLATADGSQGDSTPGSWGGHGVATFRSDGATMTIATWAELQTATNDFMLDYCDEAYLVLSEEQLDPKSGLNPLGLDLEQLNKDLALVRSL